MGARARAAEVKGIHGDTDDTENEINIRVISKPRFNFFIIDLIFEVYANVFYFMFYRIKLANILYLDC